MIQPTEKQLVLRRRILTLSIDELIENDSAIFNIDLEMPRQISPEARAKDSFFA